MNETPSTSESVDMREAPRRGAKLALIAALLGWMFDGAEMGVFTLVGRPALQDLLPPDSTENQIALWLGVITAMFLVGAATGGVLFGWLGDRIGRVRAMSLSVLCYAVFTALCGIVNSPFQLGVFRFIASLGMGGEWSLGVALVMEVWPNRSRAFMAGLIGGSANVGYVLVAIIGLLLSSLLVRLQQVLFGLGLSEAWVEHLTANQGWRVMMILGIFPALLTFFIRLFVPESAKWLAEKERGGTAHWATVDLWGVLIGALGPVLMVCLYAFPANPWFTHTLGIRLGATVLGVLIAIAGYTYPAMRYLARLNAGREDGRCINWSIWRRMLLAACLSGVALLGTWGGTQQAPAWASKLTELDKESGVVRHAREYTLLWLSLGAVVGTLIAAFLGDWLGRRKTYFLLCVVSLGSLWILFHGNSTFGASLLASAFVAGACTASFYGWLPLYLPELFTTNVRATGQGFGFNFGRILAAVGTFQLGALVAYFQEGFSLGGWKFAGGYPSACSILSLVYLLGMMLIWFAPETKGKPLPN